ncbi:unnamed protein product [Protopolystoma xenopodis]|uniref:Uncharacterized protein n=1 Tax=Protopolystoma xenopodis TaxID=117903 RepID=A0A3S5AYF4_9PLAT|nr:unnamed protein product [Protopolystoma xenopodis]
MLQHLLGLALILDCLPGASLMASLALEDIAYACYVLEYTSGEFTYALNCAEVADTLLSQLNYGVCMQAASANRVKALIIEEIAIDYHDLDRMQAYLELSRDLHIQSLDLCERSTAIAQLMLAIFLAPKGYCEADSHGYLG